MKKIVLSLASFIFFALCGYSQLKPKESPSVAYESQGIFHLATISGHILQALKVNPSIGTFAISRDAKRILFTPKPRNSRFYGGQLYLMQMSKPFPELRTHGPYYNKSRRPVEVYSDPDFSPDGMHAVFSIHSQPSGDLVEASGPFATFDLKTGTVAVLASTLHVPGAAWGTAFASSAYWSPDGQQILLNFEDGFSLTDPKGKRLVDLSPLLKEAGWTTSLGWMGPQCIVYVSGKDYVDAQKYPARFLNLKTRESGSLEILLGLRTEQVTGLVAISGRIRVRRQEGELLVESDDSHWLIPNSDGATHIRIFPRAVSEIPESCR